MLNDVVGNIEGILESEDSAKKQELAQHISDAYQYGSLSDKESEIMATILKMLVQDTEVLVRKTLAENLCHFTNVPQDIMVMLAHDLDVVALPVLEFSTVLSEEDLEHLIENTEKLTHLKAIARREHLPCMIVEALVNKKKTEIVEILVTNPQTIFFEKTLTKIIREYENNRPILELLIKRGDLPATVVEKLVKHLSLDLQETLKEKHSLSSFMMNGFGKNTYESSLMKMIQKTGNDKDVDRLIDFLESRNSLSQSIVLRALCKGQVKFFIAGLARLADFPLQNARSILQDVESADFLSLYQAAAMPHNTFDAAKVVLKFALEELKVNAANESGKPLGLKEQITSRNYHQTIPAMDYLLVLMD